MTETGQAENGKVFISYSRKDKVFVQKLNDALDHAGIQAWVDWEGVKLASDRMATITNAIQGSDALLFVVSPDSLNSKICADELDLGIKLNKKLTPTVSRKAVRIWNLSSLPLVPKSELTPFACSHLISNLSKDDWNANLGNEEYRLTCPTLPEGK